MKFALARHVATALAVVTICSVESPTYSASDALNNAGQNSACAANNGGMPCTPTEQRFVNKSVDCYSCLVNAGCLNNSVFGDTGHECGDVPGTAVNGAQTGLLRSTLCLKTIDCILGTSCASSDVAACYCGSLGVGSSCTQATSGANGRCFQQEVDALEHLASDSPSIIAPDYYNQNLGGGKANQLFSCASAEMCPMCLQSDPRPVPALPPFGVAALVACLTGMGALFVWRRHPAQRVSH